MAHIEKAKNQAGRTIFPVTVADAVLMGDGKTLKGKLSELGSKLVNYLTHTDNNGYFENSDKYNVPIFVREVFIDKENYTDNLPVNLHVHQARIYDNSRVIIYLIDNSLTWPDYSWKYDVVESSTDWQLLRYTHDNFKGLIVYILINIPILQDFIAHSTDNEYISSGNNFVYEHCNLDNCPVIKHLLDVNVIYNGIDLGERYPSDIVNTIDSHDYNEIKTDRNGVVIETINKDFEKEFNIPVLFKKPIDYPNQLPEDVSKNIFVIDDNKYSKMVIDDEGKIVYALLKDGTTFIYKTITTETEKFEVKKSAFAEYVINADNNITLPLFDKESNVRRVSDEKELTSAISYYNSGNNVLIVLNNNIAIHNPITIEGNENNELIIQGNNYSIYGLGQEYIAIGHRGMLAFSNCEPTESFNYLTDNGKPLRLSETDYYNAESRVLDTDGNTIGNGSDVTAAGIYKLKLPKALEGINIKEDDNVYINISCWFVSYTFKVLYTDSGFIYFESKGTHYSIDFDYNYGKMFPSFNLINYTYNDNGISFKENKIYFPYSDKVYQPINNTFVVNSGKVKLCNIKFTSTKDTCIVSKGILYVDNCEFDGLNNSAIYADRGSLFVTRCKFENCFKGCVEAVSLTSEAYICNNHFSNVGLRRSNHNAILACGHYYVANNYIEDYGYCGIRVGLITMPEYIDCYGIVENNILKQSLTYSDNAQFRTIMDAGAIYIATNNNPYCVCRKNKIISFNGRKDNRGIFCDDGAYNIYIVDNVIENVRNSHSISARYATGRETAGLDDNVNKVILHNYVDNGIFLEGNKNIEDNGCKLGINFISKVANISNTVRYVKHIEEQCYPSDMFISEGIVKSKIRLI